MLSRAEGEKEMKAIFRKLLLLCFMGIPIVLSRSSRFSFDAAPITESAMSTDAVWTVDGSLYFPKSSVSLPILTVDVLMSPTIVTSMGSVLVEVHVTDGLAPVEGVVVQLLSDKGGNFEPNSGLTDSNGDFTLTYFAPESNEDIIVKITASASKEGYVSASKEVNLPVVAAGKDWMGFDSPWVWAVAILVAVAAVTTVFIFRRRKSEPEYAQE